jgi:hypothetical protein
VKAVAHHLSSPDDPAKACVVQITGPNYVAMVMAAKKEAARFLKEPFANLVATPNGTANVDAVERYTAHLGVEPRPIRWRMSVTVRLAPEIVKARRERIRAARGESPETPEDEE